MAHPHKSLLEEYQYAINHLPPTVPEDVQEDAQKKHDALLADQQVDKETILDAMFETGTSEYPHRRAYRELTEKARMEQLQKMVLDHLEDNVREKVAPHLASGVSLEEFVDSSLFEDALSAEERYQVEHGILHAQDHLDDEMMEIVEEKQDEYDALVEKWKTRQGEIVAQIETLEALAETDEKWRDEIENAASRYREGFLVTEHDPTLEKVKKEIEYWQGVLAPDEEEEEATG